MPHAPAPHAVDLQAPDISPWADSPLGTSYVHERTSGRPGPEVLITALMHGNEFSGAWALDAFLRSGLQPRRGRVTAAFCNVAAFGRFEVSRPDASRFADEDMNRVWSAARLDGTARSLEVARAQALRPFADRATHLLDLHSMHEPCEPLLVAGLLARNTAFGRSLGLGAQVIVDEGHADGVRLRDYGRFGDPQGQAVALLLEAGQHWDRASLHTARNALMRFLLAAGVVERADIPPGWLLPDAASPAAIDVTHRVVAKSADFAFVEDFRGGELIARQGTVIATDGGQPVTTPYDDCVLVMPSVRQLRPGVTTVRLGRRRPACPTSSASSARPA